MKELSKNGEETLTCLNNELSKIQSKVKSLEDNLKEEKYLKKEIEKDKNALEITNSQMIEDYKQDLETLKEGMRMKSKDDEAVFKRVLDEKGKDLI